MKKNIMKLFHFHYIIGVFLFFQTGFLLPRTEGVFRFSVISTKEFSAFFKVTNVM